MAKNKRSFISNMDKSIECISRLSISVDGKTNFQHRKNAEDFLMVTRPLLSTPWLSNRHLFKRIETYMTKGNRKTLTRFF